MSTHSDHELTENHQPGSADTMDAPGPAPARRGIALCLSGGGYRAALFHLGALRRLNEMGVLSRIDKVAAVSGGSIIAAHLAQQAGEWPAPGERLAEWDERIATPFKRF